MENNSGFVFEQHPVPQQISSYQFRLIGDMTIKQFFELAGGALVSVLIYATPIPGIFKWPLVVFFVIFGAALAFLPFQERPLEQWVLAFFRSIYSPTLYVWKKTDIQSYYPATQTAPAGATLQPQTSKQTSNLPFLKNLDEAEDKILGQVSSLFGKPQSVQPQLNPTVPPAQILNPVSPVNQVQNVPQQTPYSGGGRVIEEMPAASTEQLPEASKPQVIVPQNIAQQTQRQGYQAPQTNQTIPVSSVISQVLTPQKIGPAAQVTNFSMGAAPPVTPENPNIIVGQVLDNQGKIVDGAILEIRDGQGRPVRALKSARTGHFRIVTPLENGTYKILIEKEGLVFEPVEFMATGKIIEPIMISAKAEMQIPKSK